MVFWEEFEKPFFPTKKGFLIIFFYQPCISIKGETFCKKLSPLQKLLNCSAGSLLLSLIEGFFRFGFWEEFEKLFFSLKMGFL